MKLAKSLLLGSAAAFAATAGAQAADLPVRKAAPVEYVRVCDWTGAGYFYIPGTDTCLQIGGFVRAEAEFNSGGRSFVQPQGTSNFVQPSSGGNHGTGTGGSFIQGGFISGRNRDESGFFVRGRIQLDARTQTAYGTLRTFVRYQMDKYSGAENYTTAGPSGNPAGSGNGAYIDKAFIQFAGITAGRVQSFFDFGADPYGFEGVATSDSSTQVFAYTATFAGGFSATLSLEDPNVRRYGINNSANNFGVTNASYEGDRIPDIIGQLNYTQAWGQAQLSAAYHQVNTTASDLINRREDDGFAVRGGVQVKLPFLAAGDEFQIEAGYESGAYSYQNSNLLQGGYGNPIITGGFYHESVDAIAVQSSAGGAYKLSLADGYSVSGGFQHYLTPNFYNIVFGSYEHVSYGAAGRIPYYFGGEGPASSYRIADQFNWNPVKNLQVGLEVMYIKVDQKVPGVTADTPLPAGIKTNPDAFEARLRMERDF